MGPQLCSCGNAYPRSRSRMPYSRLQWGRNFAVAETRHAWSSAGERPRFNGAATLQLRKHDLELPFRFRRPASMGPQLCSCGNRTRQRQVRTRQGCFNGAATLQLRKHPSLHTLHDTCQNGLQWGRNFAVAETLVRRGMLRVTPQLQWGRNFAVAETHSRQGGIAYDRRASMGPQLCSCGNQDWVYLYARADAASMGPQLCSCGNP